MLATIQEPQGYGPLQGDDYLGHMPPAAGTFADSVDGVYAFTAWLCAFFFVLIVGILAYSVVKWRRRTPDQRPASMVTHNTALEVTWTVIPLVLVMILFAWGWRGSMDLTMAPAGCLQYEVQARQWAWSVKHPGDVKYTTLTKTNPADAMRLYVPVNEPVKILLHSTDVLHSFYVPVLRVKRDVLPGRYQFVWFKATRKGTYPLLCTEYCGKDHSYMLGTVEVCDREVFDQKPWQVIPDDPVEYGQMLYAANCASCHSIDGSKLVGPSFKGLWGTQEKLISGREVTVDLAYLTESMREPNKEKPVGYENLVMTPFSESIVDQQGVEAIAKYLETLK